MEPLGESSSEVWQRVLSALRSGARYHDDTLYTTVIRGYQGVAPSFRDFQRMLLRMVEGHVIHRESGMDGRLVYFQ